MAKTKSEKKLLLETYKEILQSKPNYILVNTVSAGTPQINALKKLLKESKAKFYIIKNTIFKIAAQEAEQPTAIQELTEQTGLIVCGDDPTAAAKSLKSIQKEHEVMPARYGVLFGEIAESTKNDQLAEIPSREILLAKILGSMQAPITGFAQVLNGTVRNLVYALSEVQKRKAETPSA